MALNSSVDLSKILTPALLKDVLDYTYPWKGPVDVAFAAKFLFYGEPDNNPQVFDTVHFRALKPLSTLRPAVPDLTPFLPPINDPHYPERVLGLILFVDQAPRLLYNRGLDINWVYGYFDVIAKQFVKGLLAKGALPDNTKRWMALGYTFEDAMFRRFFLYTPFLHSEDIQDHMLIENNLAEMRKEVEAYSGKRDPGRDTLEEDLKNVALFAQMFTSMMEAKGPPNTFAEFFFWVFRLSAAHHPIVKQFGRYPYRNEGNGRKYTKNEKDFIQAMNNSGRTPMTKAGVGFLSVFGQESLPLHRNKDERWGLEGGSESNTVASTEEKTAGNKTNVNP